MQTNGIPMTVGGLIDTLTRMDSADVPVRIANYEGDYGLQIFSVRKHKVTDENGTVTDAYVVING